MLCRLDKGALKSEAELSGSRMPRKMETPPLKEIISTVGKSGTGAHVFVPKDWMGKKVKVILIEDDEI